MAENISFTLCFLIGLFAVGSWIDINGLWVETPLLVQKAPEQWSLPSYLVIIIQIANLGPLFYLLLNKVSKGRIDERKTIPLILMVGAVSCLLLAFFWNHTNVLFGEERSTALLILSLLLAFVDCTSSVVFLPYMAIFPKVYLTALYIGEGCSGLIPGIAALIQGIGGEAKCRNVTSANGTSLIPEYPPPNFSVKDFFIFLSILLLFCFIAFLLVDHLPQFKKYKMLSRYSNSSFVDGERSDDLGSPVVHYMDSREAMVTNRAQSTIKRRSGILPLLIMVTWINALSNGFLPSLQSYASIPYGNIPYHLSAALSNIVNPMACFATFFWKIRATRWILSATLFGTIFSAYLTYLAFASPTPPLMDSIGGQIILVSPKFDFIFSITEF